MKTIRILRLAVVLAVIAIVAVLAVMYVRSPKTSDVRLRDARIADIRAMARLCTVDFYEDVPIRASIGRRHLFGRATMTGTIGFDMDSIGVDSRGDTLVVTLPPEAVEIYESTAPDSYMVIDTWNDNMLGPSTFTTAEENAIKSRVKGLVERAVYRKEYVRRARAEAVANLKSMLSAATGRPVIVLDPMPQGYGAAECAGQRR